MKETIKKIDAAQHQLDTAIKLWFREQDQVSVHTLACSAYQIVQDITQHRKGRDLLLNSLFVKDEYKKEFIAHIKAPYNFFKHADKDPDPDGTIEFDFSLTEYFILFTILGLELNGINSTILRRLFLIYYSIHRPHDLTETAEEFLRQNVPLEKLDSVRKLGRSEFFDGTQGSQLFLGIHGIL